MDKKSAGKKPKKASDTMREVSRGQRAQTPGWATGLKQIYDSVVEEPLPDGFHDLISKLDRQR